MAQTLPIVLPVFGLILLGFLVGRTRILPPAGVKTLSDYCFWVAIPAMLFQSMAKLAAPDFFDPAILAAFFIPAVLQFLALLAVARYGFGERQPGTATFAIGATYGNILLLGIALLTTAFGERGLLLVTLIVAVHSPILLPLMALAAEARGGSAGAVARSAFLSLATNPILIGLALGFIWSRTGLGLDATLDRFLGLLAQSMAPVALFALGASLNQFRFAGDARQVAAMVAFKCAVMPALIYLCAAFVFRLDPLSTAVATICGAMPAGITASAFAQRYQSGIGRTAGTVLVSTAVACVTSVALLAWFLPQVAAR